MAISPDYARPINVNGFVCRSCDDVSDAKKFIDPSAPKGAAAIPSTDENVVTFGGTLAARNPVVTVGATQPASALLDRYA